MSIDKKVEDKYNSIKNKLNNEDILKTYDFLKGKFDKAFNLQYEEYSNEDITFRALVKLLSEIEKDIKGL